MSANHSQGQDQGTTGSAGFSQPGPVSSAPKEDAVNATQLAMGDALPASTLRRQASVTHDAQENGGSDSDMFAGAAPEVAQQVLQDNGEEDAFEEYAVEPDYEEEGSEERRVDEQEMYSTLELIAEKPKDVVQYLEEEGIQKLGEMEVSDFLVFSAFGNEPLLTLGHEHAEPEWEQMWAERLQGSGSTVVSTGLRGGGRPSAGIVAPTHVQAIVVRLDMPQTPYHEGRGVNGCAPQTSDTHAQGCGRTHTGEAGVGGHARASAF
ncbi:MAG: hypothetical protein WDW38_011262 [Sanguina aurantia]